MFGSLQVVTPPATEPVDIDLVKRHCRVDSDYDDDLLTGYATTARTMVEAWLDRALITQELLFSVTASPPPTASPLVPQSLIVFPLNWPPVIRKPIAIPRAPCVSVKQVLVGFPPDDMNPATPDDDYVLNLMVEPGLIMLKAPLVPMIPAMSLQVDYTCGYGDSGDDVPWLIRHAILMLTAALYENRGDVNGAMPDAAYSIMTPYRLWSFAG
jgi:uncharacterized phiE125 gp8 family phage protein